MRAPPDPRLALAHDAALATALYARLARASVPANDVDVIPSHRLRSMAR